jgi:tungstate transport system permease protein
MQDVSQAFVQAAILMGTLDASLFGIVVLSLQVSIAALIVAALIGLPLGAAVSVGRFPARRALIITFNAFMGLPPVVVGLLV